MTGAVHHPWWRRDAARGASESGRLWWNRVRATVLGAGAVAAAIGAVLALLPSADPAEHASLTVSIASEGMRLHDFTQLISGTLNFDNTAAGKLAPVGEWRPPGGEAKAPKSFVLSYPGGGLSSNPTDAFVLSSMAARQDADEAECLDAPCPDDTEECPDPPCPDDTEECPDPPCADDTEECLDPPCPDDTEECPDPPCPDDAEESPQGPTHIPEGLSTLTSDQERDLVKSVASHLPRDTLRKIAVDPLSVEGDCPSVSECVADPIATMIVAGGDAAPEIVAARTQELLAEIRTDDPDGAGDLLGVVVAVEVELVGLQGRPLRLWWRMYPSNSDVRLFEQWLQTTPAYHLQATSNKDAGMIPLWVPLPKAKGPYRVEVGLSSLDEGSLVSWAAKRTELIDLG